MRRREEAEAALAKIREIAKSEVEPDWPESEWKRIMAAAVSQNIKRGPSAGRPRFRPALAYGLASVLAIALIGLVLKNTILKTRTVPAGLSPVLAQKTGPVQSKPLEQLDKNKDMKPELGDRPIVVARAAKPRKPEIRPEEPAAARTEGSQDVVSVTLVSQDTGLKVIWFLDRKFEWKGKNE